MNKFGKGQLDNARTKFQVPNEENSEYFLCIYLVQTQYFLNHFKSRDLHLNKLDAVRNYLNLTESVSEGFPSYSYQKVCEALTFLLDNIYIRFGSKLYRQIVGIPIGTNCAPLVADLFL